MDTIVLASGSPQRSALLDQLKLPYLVLRPEIDEHSDHVQPEAFSRTVARDKALAVETRIVEAIEAARRDAVSDYALVISRIVDAARIWILGADTLIDLDGEMLGKPLDIDHARVMLSKLSGRHHDVITAMTLIRVDRSRARIEDTESVRTRVTFGALTQDEIDRYLASRDWVDAAGAYRIQSLGAALVESITGSYTNVVGLPLRSFCGMLLRHGYYRR